MRFLVTLWLSKLALITIKLIAPSRGTDFPGKLAYKLNKNFMKGFKNIDFHKVLFITGTNGKSTMNNLLYHILTESGKKVIANLTGSNMLNGAASCLIEGASWTGKIDADLISIEVDERSFPYIIDQLPGKNILITNIMQDQVHRNGDPDFIYSMIRNNIMDDMTMFLNNDEPRSKSYEDLAAEAYYFGVAKNDQSYHKDGVYDVTMPCPYCFEKIEFDYLNSANIGNFHCAQCSFKSSETQITQVENVDFNEQTFTIRDTIFTMPYNAPIMLYNYAGSAAVAHWLGLSDDEISDAIASFVTLEGRLDVLHYNNCEIQYLRIKQGNPETIQMAVDTIALDKREKAVAFGMCIIPERRPQWVPHYTNTYYAYEADFKPLLNDHTHMMVFSDYIAYDQLNRLLYDGFSEEDILVVTSEDPQIVLDSLCDLEQQTMYLIAPLRNIKLFKKYINRSQKHSEKSK